MNARNYVAVAAVLAAPMLLASGPARAFTARQATAGGQGIYATSSGTPQNLVVNATVASAATDDTRHPLKSLEHHDRYFANY